MERLRIVPEFSKNKKEDLELYVELMRYSNPAAHVKDVLRGVCQLPTLKAMDDKEMQILREIQRLRIIMEFSKNKKEDLELYGELIKYSSPAAQVKDILMGRCPLPTLPSMNNKKVQE